MNRGKIIFTGSFGEFFIMSLGLLVLSVITFGILLPYLVYWQFKYFFTHLEIELHDSVPAHSPHPQQRMQPQRRIGV